MRGRHQLLALAGSVFVAGIAQAAPPHISVAARIYNTARVPSDLAAAARAVAARTLGVTHIDIAWRNCDAADECG